MTLQEINVLLHIHHIKEKPDVKIIQVEGQLTKDNIEEVCTKLLAKIIGNTRMLILDCSQAKFKGTTTIEHLVTFDRDCKNEGIILKITSFDRKTLEVCRLVGAIDVLDTFATIPEALKD